MKKMSIKQLAQKLNVSVSAISRYFNNGYLSEEKKEIIRAGVEKYMYSPNKNAQAINVKNEKKVAFVSTGINVSSVNKIINDACFILQKLKINFEISFYQYDYDYAQEIITSLINSGFVNIVVFMAQQDNSFEQYLRLLREKWNINVVVFGQNIKGIPSIVQNDQNLTKQVLNRVDVSKIKNALFIGRNSSDDIQVGQKRFNEFVIFCNLHKINYQSINISTNQLNKTNQIILKNEQLILNADLIFLGYSDVARYCVKFLNQNKYQQMQLCGVSLDKRLVDVSIIPILNESENVNLLIYQLMKKIIPKGDTNE